MPTFGDSSKQGTANMQLHNQYNLHSHNVSSVANSDDSSALDQVTNDSGDGLPVYGVTPQAYLMNGAANVSAAYGMMPQEYFMSDSGEVSPVSGATTYSATTSSTTTAATWSPPPTLVGSPNGLQFDLTWDSSVVNAPPGFMQAVIDAAKYYTTLFSNKEVIAIDVGYGEIAGGPLDALSESASYVYLTNYTTVTTALTSEGFTFSATNEPTSNPFLVTSAEAKTLGIPTAGGLDGYIGFYNLSGTAYSWNTAARTNGLNTGTGPNQFDLQADAEHEISEVMGRIGLEGGVTVNGHPAYTPLDLFNYQSPGVLELSANGGYFSVNDGWINLGNYNDAAVNGGDVADWASSTSITQSNTLGLPRGSYDAYDAFAYPGYNGQVSLSDIIEDAALGYKLAPTANVALLANYMASSFVGEASLHSAAVVQDAQEPNQQPLLSHPHA